MKYLYYILIILVLGSGGFLLSEWLQSKRETKINANAEIVLEKMKKVAKLVTVEAYFSEMYDYKDFYSFDWSIFRKKALIRVRAKVSAGVNLEQAKFTTFPEQKLLKISNIPPAAIISMDHDIDYYDITEGTFNSFSKDDFNRINNDAKTHIRNTAEKSQILPQARRQALDLLRGYTDILEISGWKVEIDSSQLVQ